MLRCVAVAAAAAAASALSTIPPATAAPPRLLVGLRHPPGGRERLEALFWNVADPAHAEFRAHRSAAGIAALTAATPGTVAAARAWLASVGAAAAAAEVLPTGDALIADCPACAGMRAAPAGAPSDAVEYVLLLNHRSDAASPARRLRATKPADSSMGPAAQRAAYQVPDSLKGTNARNLQMVWGTGTFGYNKDDVEMFFNTYAPHSKISDVAFDAANKWTGQTGKNFVEGELDTSYIAAMAPGVRTLVANTNISAATESGEAFGGALLQFLVDLSGRADAELPLVLSMSLGSLSFGSCDKVCHALAAQGGHTYKECWDYLQGEFQACMFQSAEQVSRIDAEFQKLGVRGVTILAASGDGGSHFAFGPFSGGIGGALDSIICSEMNMPVYPTSSPYVLSVGGTEWQSSTGYGPECSSTRPCGWGSGGAGFSWAEAAPPYQANTTPAYLALAEQVAPGTMCPGKTYNAGGRGYPDLVALAAFGIPLCTYGGCSGSGGTSASTPAIAGLISLANDARLTAGKPPLGFVNTALYTGMADEATRRECFADIAIDSVGSLWDCECYSSCEGCNEEKGFVVTKGWDAQTGFGQPVYGNATAGLYRFLTQS